MSLKAQLQTLFQLRDEMKAQIEGLQHELRGVEKSIERLQRSTSEADADTADAKPLRRKLKRPKRGNVKGALLDLLRDVGEAGLNATSAVALASDRGLGLDRATLSSLLSRFKRDGIVEHVGDKYRLPLATSNDVQPTPERQKPPLQLAKAS